MPQKVHTTHWARRSPFCKRVSCTELFTNGTSIFNIRVLTIILIVMFNRADTNPVVVQFTGSKVMSFHYNHLSTKSLSCVNTGMFVSTTQRVRFTRISSPGFLWSGIGVSSSTQ